MKLEDYRDYTESKECTSLIVFGSTKHSPLCEILRSDYDPKDCPVTEQVFNPTKRINIEILNLVIDMLRDKVKSYTGTDKENILKNIQLLQDSVTTPENFFNWNNKYGAIFDELCTKFNITVGGRTVDRKSIGEKWSYEKNMAFWAGAIEKRRPFVLSSPYYMYGSVPDTTTIHEMLWLHDNGYSFEPIMTGSASLDYMEQIKIIAIPPSFQLEDSSTLKMVDYNKISSEQVLKSFNENILNPLNTKIHSSNPKLTLSKRYEKYQEMYNDFVGKFNGYFSKVFYEHHKDLDKGSSEIVLDLQEKSESSTDRIPELRRRLGNAAESLALSEEQTSHGSPSDSHQKTENVEETAKAVHSENKGEEEPLSKSPKPKPGGK